jgi:hypothetical protein
VRPTPRAHPPRRALSRHSHFRGAVDSRSTVVPHSAAPIRPTTDDFANDTSGPLDLPRAQPRARHAGAEPEIDNRPVHERVAEFLRGEVASRTFRPSHHGPFMLWCRTAWAAYEVVGESHHGEAIRSAISDAHRPEGLSTERMPSSSQSRPTPPTPTPSPSTSTATVSATSGLRMHPDTHPPHCHDR